MRLSAHISEIIEHKVLSGSIVVSLLLIFATTVLGAITIETLSDHFLPGYEYSGMH